MLPTKYQEFIHLSRYARFREDLGRRETWDETVDRLISFWDTRLEGKFDLSEIREAIYNLEVMPSMRSLMTAGVALDKDNVAGYNCAYLPIDHPRSFDEAMYILMCGTGVGFSVERQDVAQLPVIAEEFQQTGTTIHVRDSKKGWASSYKELIALLYQGRIPEWDVSKVRAKGMRLKTFGGRASGAEPLVDLFEYTVSIFKNAAGRKLHSIECHDIMCKVGEIVVVGGVRRSALISLSNLSDDRMRDAKSGMWWEHDSQRALANNSVAYTEQPDMAQFMTEWKSLYMSKSGERGIFSREAAKRLAPERRDTDYAFGTNPCSEIVLRPNQFCNLTEVIVRASDTLPDLMRKVRIAATLGTFQSTLVDFKYLRPIWRKNTEEERLLGVSLTGICDHEVLNGSDSSEDLPAWLEALKDVAINTNQLFASELHIPISTATTCVKPSGTVSQLTDTASGIHPRHSPYYVRTVRQDNKDPLTVFMKDAGFQHEPAFGKEDSTTVFSFPVKSPEDSLMRDDRNAIEQLELWLTYQKHWCEHKPSITVYVKEHEWFEVGAWVWKHFDYMSGVSFLPFDGGTYKQAPYQDCNEDTYRELLAKTPDIDWTLLVEEQDNTTGSQELACVGGACEI